MRRPRHKAVRSAVRSAPEIEVEITGLGAGGDGLAQGPGGRLFVPFTLPGERWRVRPTRAVEGGTQAEPVACLEPALRAEPPCPHFGRCGGCRLQHLPDHAYAAFKRERILRALAQRGLEVEPDPLWITPLASRRRLRLALAGRAGALRLGFRRRLSHEIEAVRQCPIAAPALQALLAPLASGLGRALADPLPEEVLLTLTASGVDLLLRAPRPPNLAEREALAALAQALDLARLAWESGGGIEPVVERRAPLVEIAGLPVALPPGAFLQASAAAEAELAATLAAWAGAPAAVLDLYAGMGALSLGLARQGVRVHAVDGSGAPLQALLRAARAARLQVSTQTRDLAQRPLAPAELAPFDLAILDPPRAGAAAQTAEIARSPLRRVIYASCDPATFARDARTLVDAGFTLPALRPLDQFLFSAEVELIARFERQSPP